MNDSLDVFFFVLMLQRVGKQCRLNELVVLQVPEYRVQEHCTRPRGVDPTNGPLTVLDQCVAEQYYVRNSILRSLIYSHVSFGSFVC